MVSPPTSGSGPDPRASNQTMGNQDFYNERKWCEHCKDYVRFMMSMDHSFCVQCGNKVRMFSQDDARRFTETVQRHRWQAS